MVNKQRRSEITEDRIMEAALKLFAAQGYSGTATSQIAVEAEVSEGTVFKYFPKKKDLLSKLLIWFIEKQSHEIILKPLEAIFEEHKGSEPKVVLKAIILDRMILFDKVAPFLKVMFNEIQYHPELREVFMDKVLIGVKKYGDQLIAHFSSTGQIRALPSFIPIRSFMGAAALMIFQRKYLPEVGMVEMSVDEEIDWVIDIFLNGVISKEVVENEA